MSNDSWSMGPAPEAAQANLRAALAAQSVAAAKAIGVPEVAANPQTVPEVEEVKKPEVPLSLDMLPDEELEALLTAAGVQYPADPSRELLVQLMVEHKVSIE